MLATKLLRLPERETDDTRRIAKLEKQLAAARDAVKAERAANAGLVRERDRAAKVQTPPALNPEVRASSSAERLLEVAIGALRARPPVGVEVAYIDGFLARNRGTLLGIVRGAFPAG